MGNSFNTYIGFVAAICILVFIVVLFPPTLSIGADNDWENSLDKKGYKSDESVANCIKNKKCTEHSGLPEDVDIAQENEDVDIAQEKVDILNKKDNVELVEKKKPFKFGEWKNQAQCWIDQYCISHGEEEGFFHWNDGLSEYESNYYQKPFGCKYGDNCKEILYTGFFYDLNSIEKVKFYCHSDKQKECKVVESFNGGTIESCEIVREEFDGNTIKVKLTVDYYC